MYGSLVYQDYINLIHKNLIIAENIIKDHIIYIKNYKNLKENLEEKKEQ